MTGYESKRAAAQAIDKVNWADHKPDGLAQPEQEPVAYRSRLKSGSYTYCITPQFFDNAEPLYTTPPQREWVGLTDEEHIDIAVECGCMSADWMFYGAAVERKIKEKNKI